ncbi:SDR family NAD(P)-dependent oxidoreductase [Shewanella gaetbuli]
MTELRQASSQGTQCVIIIGASSAIARAMMFELIQQAYDDLSSMQLITVSQQAEIDAEITQVMAQTSLISHHHFQCDYQQHNIKTVVESISALMKASVDNAPLLISKILICNGVLHTSELIPEKKLEDCSAENLLTILQSNTITPMLWLSELVVLVSKQKSPCYLVIFSARVGSISDNYLGGWYSYRASKAALNMLVKTAAIEYARRAKSVKLLAFHPGTTDTPLSKPFQAKVSPDKLFTPEFVAQQLIKILTTLDIDGQASFIDWQGKNINW